MSPGAEVDHPGAAWHPSPNHGPRRGGVLPRLIVLHYTAMSDTAAELRVLSDPAREVSAHYLIDRRGRVTQMVCEADRAWHAGAGSWEGCEDVNSASIGIELSNTGAEPFSEPQMTALECVMRGVMARHGIGPRGVIAHSDLAPDRKIDPGARFDWPRLARQGLAVRPEAVPPAVDFRAAARACGYGDWPDELLLRAVRLRCRPWATGPETEADRRAVAGLAAALAP
ncbi:MAG: N-acetylmuramoyl-L-alanine amidase [Shimia sp.]